MKRLNRLLFRLVYGAVAAAFCVTGLLLAARLRDRQQAGTFYEQLAPPPQVEAMTSPAPEAAQTRPALCEQAEAVRAQYTDAVCWLQIPQAGIDLPVMQGADNAYYLDHLPDGTPNALGSLFLDFRCTNESQNLVIYGHNGVGGKMFGGLQAYRDPAYHAAHPEVLLATERAVYACPIFAVREVEAGNAAYDAAFADAEAFSAYLAQAAAESLYPIAVDTADCARIVTLSTCTTGRETRRLIVQAVFPPDAA